jgi:hypothetical protein
LKLRFEDIEHLLRLAALLAAGLILFALIRAALVPKDFGILGHYRAGAVEANRVVPIVYAGQQACADCHGDVVESRAAAGHAPIACESCHGPAAAHAAAPDTAPPALPDGRELCVRCHAAGTGKPVRHPTVEVEPHAGDERCVTCHRPHDPRIR